MVTMVAHVLPQVVLVVGAAVTLLIALFAPRRVQWVNAPVTLGVLAVSAITQLDLAGGDAMLTFEELWALDDATTVAALVVLGATAVVVTLAPEWLRTDPRHGEYHTMLLLGALGAIVLAGATDLNELVVATVLSSTTGYVLAAYHRRSAYAVEAGMKYFLIGALANLVLLVGVVFAFAAGRTTRYVALGPAVTDVDAWLLVPTAACVVVGLAFKAGAVPAHAWVPDVAQGSPLPSAAFLTVVPKVGGLVALARVVDLLPEAHSGWRTTVAVVAALTMTLGNLAALRQDDVRRLLGWSSVSQAGYALMAVAAIGASDQAVGALLVFLAAYAAGNVGAFAVVGALRGRTALDDYGGLARQHPWLAIVLVVSLLSLLGLPPLAGFAGKLALFTVALDAGLAWLAVLAVVNTVISLFYYLRIVERAVLGESGGRIAVLGPWSTTAATAAVVAVVVIGLGATAILSPLDGTLLLP